ncbi:hypothetical protein ABZZ74_00935 [Streptomyces sp. NPDC006476]|uniref:aromatic-ring hydroxylase C-terminal domain-containing protein n=1 Tax=Streptomyces sp. NPDC006476 TaxID=3157175 RepID=UPI0033BB7D30
MLFEVVRHGAVLVRPDGHIAWRTTGTAGQATPELNRFLRDHWQPYWKPARTGSLLAPHHADSK